MIGGADAETEIVIEETAEEAEDVVLATAYDGAVSVLMSEVKAEFDEMLDSYIAYYAQYGYEMDKYDTDFQNSVAEDTAGINKITTVIKASTRTKP